MYNFNDPNIRIFSESTHNILEAHKILFYIFFIQEISKEKSKISTKCKFCIIYVYEILDPSYLAFLFLFSMHEYFFYDHFKL